MFLVTFSHCMKCLSLLTWLYYGLIRQLIWEEILKDKHKDLISVVSLTRKINTLKYTTLVSWKQYNSKYEKFQLPSLKLWNIVFGPQDILNSP